jgi:hypothetical protein
VELTELTLGALRLGVLVLMYALLLVLVIALFADARAARAVPRPVVPDPESSVSGLRYEESEQIAPEANAMTPHTSPVSEQRRTVGDAPTHHTPLPTRLVVIAGTMPTGGREYPLFASLTLGRGTENDICIPRGIVSGHHLRIQREGDGWLVEDLGSTNGTLLNGDTLIGSRPLTVGDRLMVGDTEIEVQ